MKQLGPDVVLWTRVPPGWSHIRPLREFVEGYAEMHLARDLGEHAGMIANELLENAVKYGHLRGLIDFELASGDESLSISVSNDALPARIRILEREMARIQECTADEVFRQAVGRLAKLPEGTTMLGLARVAAQSEVTMSLHKMRVTITATLRRPRGGARSLLSRFRIPTPT